MTNMNQNNQLDQVVESFVQEMTETINYHIRKDLSGNLEQEQAYIDGIKLAVNRLMNIADGVQKAEALANR